MKPSGLNMGLVKQQNRNSILKYLIENGPVSRKDIAREIGLTPASVTQICNELLSDDLIEEVGASEEKKGAGRKKILVDVNFNYAYIYGINIESEQTVITLSNLCGDILAKKQIKTDKKVSPKDFLQRIALICKDIKSLSGKNITKRIIGASVGIVGIVDKEKGTSVHAYGIWKDEVDVCGILKKELQVDCIIENNVNAFAIATMLFGEEREYDNLHIIKWGPGVGSTIIMNNKIYEGRHGKAAELGHVIVDKEGKLCRCGRRGCLETKVSYQALNEIVKFDRDDFASAYYSSSKESKKYLDNAIDIFARSIINSISLLAPNRVVISGFLFNDPLIRDKFIDLCKSYDESIDENRVIYNSLAEKEDYIGPIACYMQKLLFDFTP